MIIANPGGFIEGVSVENLLIAEPHGRKRTYILSAKVYSTKDGKIGYVRQDDIDESRYPELIVNMAKASEFIARADVVKLLHVDENKAYNMNRILCSVNIIIKGGFYVRELEQTTAARRR